MSKEVEPKEGSIEGEVFNFYEVNGRVSTETFGIVLNHFNQ
jgi:hypothetical protein